MFGMPVAVTVPVVLLAALMIMVTAGAVLSQFIRKQEPIIVVATCPPAHSTAWLSDGEREQFAAPGNPESSQFPL